MLVVDGPPSKGFWFADQISTGIGLTRLAEVMASLGCDRAINLDGSGSSTMVIEGIRPEDSQILNLPSDYNTRSERAVGTHLGLYANKMSGNDEIERLLRVQEIINNSDKIAIFRDKLENEGLADFKSYLDVNLNLTPVESENIINLITKSTSLNFEELKSTADKPSGASLGGVYRDKDGIVWFIKKGQHPEYEYLGSIFMNILFGNLAPKVKLVDGEKKLTGSRQIVGFIQKHGAPSNLRRYGEGELTVALDWLGVVDRHGHNMGYVKSVRGLEAARVDYDHSFSFAEKYKIQNTLYQHSFDEGYLIKLIILYSIEDIEGILKQISELPDEYVRYVFEKSVEDLRNKNFKIKEAQLSKVLNMLLERKRDLGELYKKTVENRKYRILSDIVHKDSLEFEYLKSAFDAEEFKKVVDLKLNEKNISMNQFKILANYAEFDGMYIANLTSGDQTEKFYYLVSQGVNMEIFSAEDIIKIRDNIGIEGLKQLIINGKNFSKIQTKTVQAVLEIGNIDMLRLLISKGAELNGEHIDYLVNQGGLQMLNILINDGVDLNKLNGEHVSNMLVKGGIEIVKTLINNGVQISRLDGWNMYQILRVNDLSLLRFLIKNGVDLGQFIEGHDIRKVVYSGNIETLRFLTENGVDLSKLNVGGAIAVALERNNLEMLNILIANISNFKEIREWDLIDIFEAANIEFIQFLVNNGLDLNELGSWEIERIAVRSNVEKIKYLVDKGVDLSSLSRNNIFDIAKNANVEVMKFLLDNGVDANKLEEPDILRIAETGNIEMLRVLFDGMPIKSKILTQDTILRIAIFSDIAMMKLWMEKGADPGKLIKGNMKYLKRYGARPEMLNFLINHGAPAP